MTTERNPDTARRGALDKRDVIAACELAQDYFVRHVTRSWVPAYLANRSLDAALEPGSPWGVGFAPADWHGLTGWMRAQGVPPEVVTAAGLTVSARTGSGIIDRFHDRLTLPVRDQSGSVVGFVARRAPNTSEATPKYLNSTTTLAYHKGEHLLGVAEHAAALRTGAVPVLVEGPFDAIAVSAAGTDQFVGVACCGTALTPRQADTLAAQPAGRVIVAYDADQAGLTASQRALNLIPGRLDGVALPAGSDPASCFAVSGPDTLRRLLASSRPLAEVLIERCLDDEPAPPWIETRVRRARSVAPMLSRVPLQDRHRVVATVARRLDLLDSTVRILIEDGAPPRSASHIRAGPDPRAGRRR